MGKRLLTLLFITFLFSTACYSNNLQINNVTVSTAGTDQFLNFTISWDNSWRVTNAPNNWDAVWIFVKRRECAGLRWSHADLSSADGDHTAGSQLTVDAYTDKKGVMIYRSAAGSGSLAAISIQLKLDAPPAGEYEYKVSGIEMVYVPAGSFYLGDGQSIATFRTGTSFLPYQVLSESVINVSSNAGDLWSDGFNVNNHHVLPDAYPKGFNAFYVMKYELSQGQYCDFLNSIPQDALLNRYDASRYDVNRFSITGTWPQLAADAPDRACNWMSIDDLTAYLDWSALSPMSELEFEKICRGPQIPIGLEKAWSGTEVIDANTITPGTDGTPNETVDDNIPPGFGIANYDITILLGPLRCGFAAKPGNNRFQSAAGYYGAMELSGNVFEICVNADSSLYGKGHLFNGSHGDGELSTTPLPGLANQGWPGQTFPFLSEPFTSYTLRGGAWSSTIGNRELQVSSRQHHLITTLSLPVSPDPVGRHHSFGGRGVSRRL